MSSTRRRKIETQEDFESDPQDGHIKMFLTASAVSVAIATPALAQTQISQHRAVAIEACSQQANAEYGPSGDVTLRRFNHDAYAACMADKGEAS